MLTAQRHDRADSELVARLHAELAGAAPSDPAALLRPRGTHRIPDRYAPTDLLVRTR